MHPRLWRILMFLKLFKNITLACLVMVITQAIALSFTLEVAGKIDVVTDPVKKNYLFTDKQLLTGHADSQHCHLYLLDATKKV